MKRFYYIKLFCLYIGVSILPLNVLNSQCNITVDIFSSGWGDETTWTLVDNLGNTVLNGGAYGNGYYDSQSIIGASNDPYTLNINASGPIGDNSPNYEVLVNGVVEFSGNVSAGTNASIGPISCNSTCVSAPVPDDACYQQVISDDPFCCDVS